MNARNKAFWDIDTTNTDARASYAYLQTSGMTEMRKEPSRNVGNTKSYIDLIITNNSDHIMCVESR